VNVLDANRIPELDDQFEVCREVNLQHRNAEFVGEAASFREMYESRLPESQPYEPLVLRMEGALLFNQEQFDEAIKVFEHTLDVSRALQDVVSEAMAYLGIGNCLTGLGKFADAIESFQRSVTLMETQDDIAELLSARSGLALAYVHASEYRDAARILHENLDIARNHGDTTNELWALSNIAAPHFYMGDYGTAIKHTLSAYDMSVAQGNERLAMQAAGNISYVASEIGAIDMARRWIKPVLEYHERSDHQREYMNTRLNALRLEIDAAPTPENVQALELAINEVIDTPMVVLGVEMVPFLVDTYLLSDRIDDAAALLQQWNSRADETQHGPALQSYERVRLALRVRQGDLEGALDSCDRALEVAREQSLAMEIEKLLDLRVAILRSRGAFEEALSTYQEYVHVRFTNEQGRSLHAATALEVQHEHDRLSLVSEKQQDLLSSVMPNEIVERLMKGEQNIADAHDDASVMFLDLVSFTDLSSSVPPAHLIHLLNAVFSTCDDVVQEHGLTKIKTIGDSYMAVSGLPHAQEDHAQRMANAAMDMMSRLRDLKVHMPAELGDTSWVDNMDDLSVRIGLHCGAVVAGVIGRHRAQYDVWGDTVNTASRMESTGQPDRIHISEDFAMTLADGAAPEIDGTDIVIRKAPYQMRLRGTTTIKGKGDMKTFWLEGM
jgi:class 3 adenylate cyclase